MKTEIGYPNLKFMHPDHSYLICCYDFADYEEKHFTPWIIAEIESEGDFQMYFDDHTESLGPEHAEHYTIAFPKTPLHDAIFELAEKRENNDCSLGPISVDLIPRRGRKMNDWGKR